MKIPLAIRRDAGSGREIGWIPAGAKGDFQIFDLGRIK
jgi:hypothetical protein